MAYAFTAASNHKVEWGHLSALDGATKLTASFWAKPESSSNDWKPYLYQGNEGNVEYNVFIYSGYGTKTAIAAKIQDGANLPTYSSNNVLTLGAWTHIVVCYDGTVAEGSRVAIFVNGSALSLAHVTAAPSIPTTSGAFTTGAAGYGGALAEVALWIGEDLRAQTTLISNLAAGRNPLDPANGRPTGLDFYAPMRSDLNELQMSLTGTATGATTTTHPSVDDVPSGGSLLRFVRGMGGLATLDDLRG